MRHGFLIPALVAGTMVVSGCAEDGKDTVERAFRDVNVIDETNLNGDRNYGSKNEQRAAYTETLGRIISIHGNSPVGQEAAYLMSDYLSRMARVETKAVLKNGPSVQACEEKYGFKGGDTLFGFLASHPAAVPGSDEILQTLRDTRLNTVGSHLKALKEETY